MEQPNKGKVIALFYHFNHLIHLFCLFKNVISHLAKKKKVISKEKDVNIIFIKHKSIFCLKHYFVQVL